LLIIGNIHSHPSAKSFLKKFAILSSNFFNNVLIVSGDAPPHLANIRWIKTELFGNNIFVKTISLIITQIHLLYIILFNINKYDLSIIFPTPYFMPTIFLRFINRPTAVFVAQKPKRHIELLFSKINIILSNYIIIESMNVLQEWSIERYKSKSLVGSVFVDTSFFKKTIALSDRKKVIGYLGVLAERKGFRELSEAMAILQKSCNDVKFLIGGTGELEYLVINPHSNNNYTYLGFVSENRLPEFYNKLKLLVLPSYTEGLPNVLLEAMACGTPVLVTPVGSIPDIIRDFENGFILPNNSPDCIVRSIRRILERSSLDDVAKNGLELIKKNFSEEAATARYNIIFNHIIKK
jgi:glycosyltransferase involved in cell wall biosynthesis